LSRLDPIFHLKVIYFKTIYTVSNCLIIATENNQEIAGSSSVQSSPTTAELSNDDELKELIRILISALVPTNHLNPAGDLSASPVDTPPASSASAAEAATAAKIALVPVPDSIKLRLDRLQDLVHSLPKLGGQETEQEEGMNFILIGYTTLYRL
jgi:hypothetical protein